MNTGLAIIAVIAAAPVWCVFGSLAIWAAKGCPHADDEVTR